MCEALRTLPLYAIVTCVGTGATLATCQSSFRRLTFQLLKSEPQRMNSKALRDSKRQTYDVRDRQRNRCNYRTALLLFYSRLECTMRVGPVSHFIQESRIGSSVLKRRTKERERTQEKKKGKKECESVFQWSIQVDTSQKRKQIHIQYSCPSGSCITQKRLFIIIIIIIIMFIDCKWVDTRWQWSFNMLHMHGLCRLII